ncbi:hypothetical protein G7Y89_g4818 [Cudoniella acicularis]|uniref:C2H2-type domain-containing protein n=1 Tax=Cudoniella acicularis TaxID=354080 RepID=A0A8H4RNP5_9HELO|nr:hypothetical protein G7Y89_g4818 [Cudoniella acicularis]
MDATDFALLRNFPKHKSSHLRFLAWVAYTRKFTDDPITEDERRTCPLLWCRTVFKDQETMLQHVWNCEHLSKGLYWCFHCQKPERVGKFFQCKRCQGTPSRADRITTVAKRIFSKLGSRSHRSHPFPESEPTMALAEVSKSSKGFRDSEYPDIPAYDAGPANAWGQLDMQEMENTSTKPSLELPDTQICEMSGSGCPLELNAGPENWTASSYAEPEQNWYNRESSAKLINPAPKAPRRQESNLTPIKTHFDYSSRGPVRQQGPPTDWSDEPMSATIISPLGEPDRYASIFQEISPTGTDASGDSFLTDSGYTSATIDSAMNGSGPASFELHPGFNQSRGKKRPRDSDAVSSEHVLEQTVSRSSSVQSKSLASKVGSVSSSHSPSRCPSTKKPKLESPHWNNAQTLVQSFAEVLDAHICHSKDILRHMPSTPVTTELLAMSRTSMVSIGLEALAGIIEGRNPTAIVQAFAFTHIAYAFTIAIDDNEIKVRTKEWFEDSLSWVEGLGSERQRKSYERIATAIWQPANSISETELPRLFGAGNQENRLFLACKRFLDAFESFYSSDSDSSETEKISDSSQALFANNAQSQVIDELIKTNSIEAFIEDVVKVEKRLNRGHIKNVRELELELMCAGKLASQSELAYTRFLSQVTNLCDTLYTSPTRERSVFHIHDISLVKQLLPEELYTEHHGNEREFEPDLDDELPLGFDVNSLPRCQGEIGEKMHDFMRDADKLLMDDWQARPTASKTPHVPPKQQQTPTTYQCDLCPYIPLGEEKWKASNLRRHKRTQHAKKGEYVCKWPDCGRSFTRSDNLRSHMRDKGHESGVKKASSGGKGKGKERAVEEDEEESDESDLVISPARSGEDADDAERGAKRRRKAGGGVMVVRGG